MIFPFFLFLVITLNNFRNSNLLYYLLRQNKMQYLAEVYIFSTYFSAATPNSAWQQWFYYLKDSKHFLPD